MEVLSADVRERKYVERAMCEHKLRIRILAMHGLV